MEAAGPVMVERVAVAEVGLLMYQVARIAAYVELRLAMQHPSVYLAERRFGRAAGRWVSRPGG